MKFILFIKDDIAVAKCCASSIDNLDLGAYDRVEQIAESEYEQIELPSIFKDGKWIKSDTFPAMQYEKANIKTPNSNELTTDDLAVAILEGVNEV